MKTTSTQNVQIRVLSEQGYTPEQIASGLGLVPDAVKLIIAGFQVGEKKAKSLKERYGDVEELAMNALCDICEHSDNHGAKVMAARTLLERKEALNSRHEFDYDEIALRLAKSKELNSESQVVDNVVQMESSL